MIKRDYIVYLIGYKRQQVWFKIKNAKFWEDCIYNNIFPKCAPISQKRENLTKNSIFVPNLIIMTYSSCLSSFPSPLFSKVTRASPSPCCSFISDTAPLLPNLFLSGLPASPTQTLQGCWDSNLMARLKLSLI